MSGKEFTWSIGTSARMKTTPCNGENDACAIAAERARKEELRIYVYRDGFLYCYYDESGLHWD